MVVVVVVVVVGLLIHGWIQLKTCGQACFCRGKGIFLMIYSVNK